MNATGTEPITNAEVIDSREVIARIDYLTGLDVLDDDETDELAALTALAVEASDYAADWQYGETLIRDDYFVTYAQQLAEDCGLDFPRSDQWPYTYVTIDWQGAARALQQDYMQVTFDTTTYWVR